MQPGRSVVAIDGPAGSGKSTTARRVAAGVGFLYFDTGALYRAVTLKALDAGADLSNDSELGELVARTKIRLEDAGALRDVRVFLDDADVSEEVRTMRVSEAVSQVSASPSVRRRLMGLQREIARYGDVVVEGRDIATVVFPEADVKIFLVANVDERADRRLRELRLRGDRDTTLEEVRRSLEQRDATDSGRVHSPLRKADDAVEIDTSGLTIDQQVERVESLCRQELAAREATS